MKVAILCFTPLLLRTWPDRYEGLKIGVNRCALRYDVDVWAAFDSPLILTWADHVIGSPWLYTSGDTRDCLRRHGSPWADHVRIVAEDLYQFCPLGVTSWTLFTATASLVLAASLGATRIDVYGVEWSNAPDPDGYLPEGCRRDEHRWKSQEIPIWSKVVDWLAGRGVEVIRHG